MAARTPRVMVVLNLQHDDGPQERVLQVTAGHEVVEDRRNGVTFQFKRKRSALPPPPAAAPTTAAATAAAPSTSAHKLHLLKTPAGKRLAQAAGTACTTAGAGTPASPYADELELPRLMGERLMEGIQALPERAPPGDRLLAFCSSICVATAEAAARQPGGAARAAVLSDAFASFRQALAVALQEGSIQLAGVPPRPGTPTDEGEVEQPGYQVDLQARKAGLRARLANFQKEEAEWHALLGKVEQLDQQQLAAEAKAAPDGGQPAGSATDGDAAAAAEAAAAAGQPGGGDELAALAALHAGVHRHLAMQVEGVCKLVEDVEEMVERANRSAQAVQAEYHAEKLRVFPHVDSPARLIRELVRPAGKAAAHAQQQQHQTAAAGKENAVEAV